MVGQHHRIFVDPVERESDTYKKFWEQLGSGQHYTGQYKRIAKGDRVVWIQGSYSPLFDSRGRPYKVVKHAIDVTAQRLQTADMESWLAAIYSAQAVDAMHAIVFPAVQVNQSVDQIANAADSQASGISQVNIAIERLRASSAAAA